MTEYKDLLKRGSKRSRENFDDEILKECVVAASGYGMDFVQE